VTDTVWSEPRATPRLSDGVVDVWRADLAVAGEPERSLLSPAERARADRFVRPEDGRRWARARGILRALLGDYADADPAELRFEEGAHGKPALVGHRLRFNLSHSGDTALYALALGVEVGVDVELPRRELDHVALAARALGAETAARLEALDPAAREREFLRAWVRWEAVLKCRGTGIGGVEEAPAGPAPWVRELDLGEAGAAALAVADSGAMLRCWRWPIAGA